MNNEVLIMIDMKHNSNCGRRPQYPFAKGDENGEGPGTYYDFADRNMQCLFWAISNSDRGGGEIQWYGREEVSDGGFATCGTQYELVACSRYPQHPPYNGPQDFRKDIVFAQR
jgi:hypothetical protein